MKKLLLMLLAGCCSIAFSAHAEEYPTKPIRIVVPGPAGSSADVLARQLGKVLSEKFSQSVIIDNRPGANGIIGAQVVAQAPPDGYTLLLAGSSVLTMNPYLVKDLGFDAQKDFVPIIVLTRAPALVVVSPASPYQSLQEFIEAAKKSPGKLTFASSGEGSPQHIMGEKMKRMAGIDLNHIPYKGETPALQDLMAGQIDLCFGFAAGTMPHVRSGKLRVLAVTSEKRFSGFPDIPTVAEEGLAGYAETSLTLYLAPRGTPAAIVDKLNDALRIALLTMKKVMLERGSEFIASSPQEAIVMLENERVRNGKVVNEL